ncbi:MAG: hypothetical protein ACOC1K_03950 [Nanoarchaeota archaeon]
MKYDKYNPIKNPVIIVFIFLIIVSITHYNFFSEYESLPSPIYGGDLYYQAGSIEHISKGGNFFESSSFNKGVPGYLPLYGLVVSVFKLIFKMDTFNAMYLVSILITILSGFLYYLLFKLLTKQKLISATLTVFFLGIGFNLKYTDFAYKIMLPLYVIFLYKLFNEKNLKNTIVLGVILGLLSYANNVFFIGATIILVIFYGLNYKEIISSIKIKKNIHYIIPLIITFLFAIFIWYKPIFIYHLKPTYPRFLMDLPDFSRFSIQFNYLVNYIKSFFFNFSNIKSTIISMSSIVGLSILFLIKNNKENTKFIKQFLIASIILTFSYFITQPFLGLNFYPNQQQIWLNIIIKPLLLYFTLSIINKQIKNKLYFQYLLIGIIVVFGFLSINNFVNANQESRWNDGAKLPIQSPLKEATFYLNQNSNVNDVILTNKETGFALNSLTGMKLVVNRWAQQNDPFINMPQRDIDAAIILYGNDIDKKKELIQKYDIDYLYWDTQWINMEYRFDEQGNLVSWFDPLIAYENDKTKQLLDNNSVSYFTEYTWVDPSVKNENIKKFDLIFVSPDNYHNFTNPWNPNLNELIKEVWSYESQGMKVARIYEFVI